MRKTTITVVLVTIIKFLILLVFWYTCVWAGSSFYASGSDQVLYPYRTPEKPEIDGILDDEAWQQEPLEKDFVSFYPIFGEALPYKTVVRMAYDSENLYFAFQCYDPEPQKIKTSITRRDDISDHDRVGLSIDAVGNRQTTYDFFVNANGIQEDFLSSAVSGEDSSPDFVWESAAQVTDQGYQAEMRIPLQSIRFKAGKEVNMGILLMRQISRLGLIGSWPEIKPGQGFLSGHTRITYNDLEKPSKLAILPSITHSSNHERKNLQEWGKDRLTAVGIGLTYGITSAITADITINPDFNQVESDAFQVEVNQRYPLFYREKRPFFMEGSDTFLFFTLPWGNIPWAVHTRRIVNPAWGIKLTGSVGKVAFGILSAGDEKPGQDKAFFGITRGKYSLNKDNYIGILYSGRERAGQYNRVFGADMNFRLFKNQQINASFLHSMTGSDLAVDPQHLKADNYNLRYLYESKPLKIDTSFEHIGTGFRIYSGFLKRTGIDQGFANIIYYFYPSPHKLNWLKRIGLGIESYYLYDLSIDKEDYYFCPKVDFTFIKQGYGSIYFVFLKENWQEKAFEINRFQVYAGIQLTRWLQVKSNIAYGKKIYYEAQPAYRGKGWDGEFSLLLQANKNLSQYFTYTHSDLSGDRGTIYDVNIFYSRTIYQFNKYFFLRAILQYDSYRRVMLTDFLASFTLSPGTVLHAGYGGLYENRPWQEGECSFNQGDLLEIKRSFFLKASYLWRF
jgi:hypothetical protein